MNLNHGRKRAQAVAHDGLLLPKGAGDDRECDYGACALPSADLVAAPDGSVLLVCVGHARILTTPEPTPRVAQPTTDATPSEEDVAPVVESAGRRRRSVWPLVRVAAGGAVSALGLALCAETGSDLVGVLTGTAGMWLVASTVLPRR